MMPQTTDALVDVLIASCQRPIALPVTLAALSAQTLQPLRIVISDQSDNDIFNQPELSAIIRYLRHRGHQVALHHHVPRRGMAEQRAFLLAKASTPYCLFLDDDVLTEPDLIERLYACLQHEQCGFIGSALHGLSFADDHRPHQQAIDFWEDRVTPETVTPASPSWQRHHLHSAANLLHVQQQLAISKEENRCYKVAWVGGCVMFNTSKLRDCGGFDFWPELPPEHCGEDVLAQLRVMERYGGCALIPSGAYHLELPTTLPARHANAPYLLRQVAP